MYLMQLANFNLPSNQFNPMKKLFLNGMAGIFCLFFIQVSQGQNFSATIQIVTGPSCQGANGELNAVIQGGTAPFTYRWYGSYNQQILGTDATLTNVSEGVYTVLVTDALGLGANDSTNVGYKRMSASASPAHCPSADGSATVQYNGIFASPVTIIWSNGATTQTVTGLAAGEQLTVQVTDANGCPFTFTEYINDVPYRHNSQTIEVGSIPSFTMDHQYNPATCTRPDGYAKINVTGTTAPYTYIWNTSPVRTGDEQFGLTTGSYTVRVTDNIGCFGDHSFNLTNTPGGLSGYAYTSQQEYCLRQNGVVMANVSGGTTPYTIKWATGETGVLSLSNLSAGYYSVNIKDAENCEITKTVLVDRYSPMSVHLNTVSADCNNQHGVVNANVVGGTLPYTFNWSNGAVTQNATELGIGWYTLVATDTEGCTTYEHVSLNTEPGCQGNISGLIYQDNNNNCIKDAGEPVIVKQSVIASNITTQYGLYGESDATGSYSLRYPYNGTYKLNTYSSSPYYISQCPINGTTKTVTAPNDYTYNIGMVPIAIGPDLQTSIYSTWVRPGFSYNYDVYVHNVGTQVVSSGTVEIQLGNIESLIGFTDFPASYDPVLNKVVFDINNLKINEVIHFRFTCKIAPTTLLNTHFDVTAVAYPLSGDLEESTNSYILKQTVVGSYDPNDIQSFKTGDLSLGEDTALTYQIRFQNTGNFYAEFVVVRDTLDAKLDPSTLRDIQSSHPVSVTLLQDNIIEFVFNDIFLQDSTSNEEESHGFVTYKINLKKNVIAGDNIQNRAAIFFDYNAPVITNKVNNRVAIPASIQGGSNAKHTALVFPNPAHDQASFSFPEAMQSFQLLNAFGEAVYSVYPNQKTVQVNTSLWRGMHYYKASNAKGEIYSGKIIIE